MAQLKMYWIAGTAIREYKLPEGYSFSKYRAQSDKLEWCECCKNGLVPDDANERNFYKSIEKNDDINPFEDVIFLDHEGKHVGTVTAYVEKETGAGVMHMVGIRNEYRGKGLSKYLCMITLQKLNAQKVEYIYLTTDEWRKSAVKGYLSAGFLPVEYEIGMQDRWEAVLEEYAIECVQMLYEDCTPFKVIYRKSKAPKVKFGVFGAGRGKNMMKYCLKSGNAQLVAVCDSHQPALDSVKEYLKDKTENVSFYDDFDEFLGHGMDCVVLANYANEHAPYAIKCMNAGKHVLSEVLPVQTMKEAVELVEAVERTGMIYAYAENYCFMPAPKKMKELYEEGKLGKFEYGEGEYMHNCESGWHGYTRADKNHWRNTMSAFYYCTHSLGPIIHITGMRPVSVTGFEVPFNDRMMRMGAKAGSIGIEMVTLENSAVVKSLHGVGPSKSSVWYSIYGSKGRMESAREDTEKQDVHTLYVNCDEEEGDNSSCAYVEEIEDSLTELSEHSGHGGSDYYVMHHLVQKIRGNRNADTIDVYEALDMFLPGMFAYRSVLNGGAPMEIPNLRDKAQRDKWRNDTQCTDPKAAGDMLVPSYSKGNPDIPDEIYENLAKIPEDVSIGKESKEWLKKQENDA